MTAAEWGTFIAEGYPHHQPAYGIPEALGAEHPAGDCAWCDAIRYRQLAAYLRATGRENLLGD